jgi:hypothetical protein
MRRFALVVLMLTVIAGAVTGFAASLNVTSAQLGSGIAPVTTCDTDGVRATYSIGLGLVTAVVVTGIADGSSVVGAGACDGERVYVEALNSSGNPIVGAAGSSVNGGDVDTPDNVKTVPLGVPPLASAVAGVRITISG